MQRPAIISPSPRDFSPNDDSCVRNRAFALRRRLEEFYERESPEAGLRIELPKGSYLPRFAATEQAPLPDPPVEIGPAVESPARIRAERRWPIGLLALTLVAGLMLGG